MSRKEMCFMFFGDLLEVFLNQAPVVFRDDRAARATDIGLKGRLNLFPIGGIDAQLGQFGRHALIALGLAHSVLRFVTGWRGLTRLAGLVALSHRFAGLPSLFHVGHRFARGLSERLGGSLRFRGRLFCCPALAALEACALFEGPRPWRHPVPAPCLGFHPARQLEPLVLRALGTHSPVTAGPARTYQRPPGAPAALARTDLIVVLAMLFEPHHWPFWLA